MTVANDTDGAAERLAHRIAELTEANRTLRELAAAPPPPMELEARTILLRREAGLLENLVAERTAYAGGPPATLAEYEALPEAHRRQVARDHGDHLLALRQVEQLLATAPTDAGGSFL
ncbi:MAG: hypothetical protein GX591_16610 [Planctomycetes bacterium]|nr:hypothetical protein [Planctomycetota bacterium]